MGSEANEDPEVTESAEEKLDNILEIQPDLPRERVISEMMVGTFGSSKPLGGYSRIHNVGVSTPQEVLDEMLHTSAC